MVVMLEMRPCHLLCLACSNCRLGYVDDDDNDGGDGEYDGGDDDDDDSAEACHLIFLASNNCRFMLWGFHETRVTMTFNYVDFIKLLMNCFEFCNYPLLELSSVKK